MPSPASALARALDNRNLLGLLFMLPAAALLLLFLTYPLGLGTYLGFTDTKVGRGGVWIGIENYEFLWGDAVTRLALFNTLFYTFVASVIKFALGLWLALLLNKHLPFKAMLRAVVLLPFTDFQLIYVLTRGGPLNATHLMATLSFQRAIPGGNLGEGAAIATAMVPFLLAAILISYFGLQRRAWQQGSTDK